MIMIVYVLASSIFMIGLIIGILVIVTLGIRREERLFREHNTSREEHGLPSLSVDKEDTPLKRAQLTLREILGNPRKTSIIKRTPVGDLTVNRTE
jgi:hypothetical protein